ncbi:Erp family outer-surface lipoprotein (plasmid) [Borreliella yangtzensis]|uniref:Outer surface protein E n=1 Tax=Borreliella yangtzensis TaxID=683292 RepID=A0ABR6PBE0_9SPIR|nr:hypothetical protein [Borreliella yangtzensis]
MNKKVIMFIICAVFAVISSCENFTSTSTSSTSEQINSKTIEFTEFTVKIKNKDNGGNWTDLGDLVVEKEERKKGEYGIATGLNAGGHSATFFEVEESEVNNFVKAMTEGGAFKASLYYGYGDEQSNTIYGIQNKEIKTKIEAINGSEYITFSGDKIKDSGDKTAEYAIPLVELKNNLK